MAATSPTAIRMRDEVFDVGNDRELVSILTRPDGGAGDRPAVIFLNAGVLHRVGPHRLHVTLARRLAARGLPALRIDLGGVGDSPPRGDAISFQDSAVADTRAAMTALTAATGAARFILAGLCAGADNSVATALVDPRVAGVVLLDPPTYASRQAQLRKLGARVRLMLGPRRRTVVFLGGGGALTRTNEPLFAGGDRSYLGPWGAIGVESLPLGVLVTASLRFSVIRDGQGTVGLMLSVGAGR